MKSKFHRSWNPDPIVAVSTENLVQNSVFRVLILVSSPWSSSEEPASSPAWCTNGWSVLRPTADPRWWLGLRPSVWRPGWTLRATSHKRTDKVSLSKLSSDHLFYKPTLCFLCRDFGEERHLRHRHEGETQQLQEHSDDKGCQLPFITTWQWWKQPKFYRIPIKLPLKNKKKTRASIGFLWWYRAVMIFQWLTDHNLLDPAPALVQFWSCFQEMPWH